MNSQNQCFGWCSPSKLTILLAANPKRALFSYMTIFEYLAFGSVCYKYRERKKTVPIFV